MSSIIPSLSGVSSGGNNSLTGMLSAGTNATNATAGLSASQSASGVNSFGAFAGVNSHGHGLGVETSVTPGIQSTISEAARINLYNDPIHRVDTSLTHSTTHLNNPDFTFNKIGGSVDYSHIQGHGASLGVTHIPNIGSTLNAAARANLWSSPDRMSTLDASANMSRGISGHLNGQQNFGAGLGFTQRF